MTTGGLRHEVGAREASPAPGHAPGLGPALMRAAWLAILLGLGFEVVLLAISVYGGSGTGTFVADLVKSVSWSVFVCVGLAVGTAIAKARVPLMGVLGLLAAPSRSRSRAPCTRGPSRHSPSPAARTSRVRRRSCSPS